MYYFGRGVPQDYSEAVRWYRKAAEQGDVRAQESLEGLGSWSRPPTKTRYLALSMALLTLTGALWFLWSSLEFLLKGRKLREWRQVAEAVLGFGLLAYSGLCLYAFVQDIQFCPYPDAFHTARRLLAVGVVSLLLVILFVPAKRRKISQTGAP